MFIDNENQIFAYNRDKFFPNNQLVPLKGRRGLRGSSGEGVKEITHIVKSGENISSIASKYKVTVSDIKEWNDIRKKNVRVGQRLTVYVASKSPKTKLAAVVKPKKEVTPAVADSSSLHPSTTEKTLATVVNAAESTANSDYILYTIQSGDSLFTIAKKFPGITDAELMAFNNIRNVKGLVPGRQLKIPKKA